MGTIPEAAEYAHRLLEQNYGWEQGDMLPGGKDPRQVVFEVFSRVAAGKRKLNTRYSYEVQLKGMVRSLISNLYRSTDAKLKDIHIDEDEPGSSEIKKALTHDPDSQFESDENSERFQALLEQHPKVRKDPDLWLVITAYMEGANDPAEAAEATGIPITRVYEYNRSLNKILHTVQTQMKELEETK